MRAAIEIARQSRSELRGVAVIDPVFLSGPAAPSEAREAIASLEEEAAAHGVEVEGGIHRGNPVRTLVSLSAGVGLVVLGVGSGGGRLLRGMGIGGWIARAATPSVLLVPV
jgi:nucleotide-binding universal stress UspA family protein